MINRNPETRTSVRIVAENNRTHIRDLYFCIRRVVQQRKLYNRGSNIIVILRITFNLLSTMKIQTFTDATIIAMIATAISRSVQGEVCHSMGGLSVILEIDLWISPW